LIFDWLLIADFRLLIVAITQSISNNQQSTINNHQRFNILKSTILNAIGAQAAV
jgi:hypothetical protein